MTDINGLPNKSSPDDTDNLVVQQADGQGFKLSIANLLAEGRTAIANLAAAFSSYIPLSQKGAAGGVATLGSDGKVPATQLPASSGGGTLTLTTEISNALTALTDITTGSGTWSINNGQVQVAGTSNTQCSAFLATPISSIGFCSMEVEVEIPSTFNSGCQLALRLTRGGIGNNNGALNINLGSTNGTGVINKANIDNQGLSNLASKEYTIPTAGTWVKLTIKKIGDSYCFYINGAKYFETMSYWALGTTDDFYVGFGVYNSITARFRNLVVKTLSI